MGSRTGTLKNAALVALGGLLALGLLESALRVTGWVFLRARQPARLSPAAASSGTIRILCLGESTTADLRVLGQQSYPVQLERILNERSRADRFVVINGGVPATTTDLIVEKLPAALDEHRPDIVVTMMGVNDGPLADPLLAVQYPGRALAPLRKVLAEAPNLAFVDNEETFIRAVRRVR